MDPKSNLILGKLKRDILRQSSVPRPKKRSKRGKRKRAAVQTRIARNRNRSGKYGNFSAQAIHATYSGEPGSLDFTRSDPTIEAIYKDRRRHNEKFRLAWRVVSSGRTTRFVNSRIVSQELIRSSAWWWDHPSGQPVQAPKHYLNLYVVYDSQSDWRINFGANTFHVGSAASECLYLFLRKVSEGKKLDKAELNSEMVRLVQGNVSNYAGEFYYEYPSLRGFMHFGTQAISVQGFITRFYKDISQSK